MKSQKGFAPVIIILIIILGIGGVYYLKTTKPEIVTDQTPNISASPLVISSPTSHPVITWKTYIDDQYGFKFGYPSLYEVKETADNHIRLENPASPFGEIIEIATYEEVKDFNANKFVNEVFYLYPGLTNEMKEIWLKDLVIEETTIDGHRAFKIDGLKNIAGDYGTGTLINTASYQLFVLSLNPQLLGGEGLYYYDYVLSTLKFTN